VNRALPQIALERAGNNSLLRRLREAPDLPDLGEQRELPTQSLFARSPKVGWDRNADKPRDDEKLATRRQHGLSGRTEGDAVAS
jgi:hypothetical protein